MSNTTASLLPVKLPGLFRFTREQYYRMDERGIFDGRHVELLNGLIWEQHRPFRFSREQYYQLGDLGFFDGARVERLNGEIHEMSPLGWLHVLAKTKTANILREVFTGIGWVNEQGVLTTDHSDPQPDIAVIPGRMEDYTDHPGTAFLIVEVADSSVRIDKTDKAELYAAANILDYWVLDVAARELTVFRDPIQHSSGVADYANRQTYGSNDRVTPLAMPNASVKVADLLP